MTLRAYPNYPLVSVCHSFVSLKDRSEAKPKSVDAAPDDANLGWVSPFATQILRFAQNDKHATVVLLEFLSSYYADTGKSHIKTIAI
jgi:hypothetical protein